MILFLQSLHFFNDKTVKFVDIVFIDESNAFHSIPYGKLLEKLYKIGINRAFLSILESYISNRKQFVTHNKLKSNLVNVTSGCPQGGVLSPTLFNIYTSDMPNVCIYSKIVKYADDCVLIMGIRDVDIVKFQTDLNNIQKYCSDNNLVINSNKSFHLRISMKSVQLTNIYKINNIFIKQVETHKHLGVIIDNKLTFNSHCDYIINNAYKKWAIIKRFCKRANFMTYLNLYRTYILPIIEYCSISWCPNQNQTNRIESVQRNITRFICYKLNLFDVDYKTRLEILGLKALDSRRNIKILSKVFAIKYNKEFIPNDWFEKYKFVNTRIGRNIIVPKTRINFCDKNFFIYSFKLFNNQTLIIRDSNSYSSFFKHINDVFL